MKFSSKGKKNAACLRCWEVPPYAVAAASTSILNISQPDVRELCAFQAVHFEQPVLAYALRPASPGDRRDPETTTTSSTPLRQRASLRHRRRRGEALRMTTATKFDSRLPNYNTTLRCIRSPIPTCPRRVSLASARSHQQRHARHRWSRIPKQPTGIGAGEPRGEMERCSSISL